MGLYDASLGGLLGGTWANSYVFCLEILELFKYYQNYPNDPLFVKLIVGLTASIDTLSTIGNYACVYMYTVTHWGDAQYLLNQYWPIPVYLSTTGASAFIVQSFLVHRYWQLARNPIITFALALLVLAAFGGALATAVIIIITPTYKDRNHVQIPVTVWLVSSAVADITIAGSLIWRLWHVKTTTTFKTTRSLIHRTMSLAVQTGSATTLVAVIALIIYLQNNESNISVGVAFTLGRMYALTMLRNLNTRVVRDGPGNSSGKTRRTNVEEPPITLNETFGGVHVHRTAVVHMDDRSTDVVSQKMADDKSSVRGGSEPDFKEALTLN